MSFDVNKAEAGSKELYLDLLKKTLRFSFWEDPGKPLEAVAYRAGFLKPFVLVFALLIKRFRLRMVVMRDMEQELQLPGSTWPACAHSMVGRGNQSKINSAGRFLVLDAENRGRLFRLVECAGVVMEKGCQKPEDAGLAVDHVIFPTELLRSTHPEHFVTFGPHLIGGPS